MTRQQWVTVDAGPSGTFIKVTIVEGTNVVRRKYQSYTGHIKQDRKAALAHANTLMTELHEAEAEEREEHAA